MSGRKESAEVNQTDSFFPEANDVVRLEVDEDDAVVVKPRHDR